jgi:transcriptional regulator with XRE-family HTH domain
MIRNERQYRVTMSERDRLATELRRISEADVPTWVAHASRDAITSQVMEMDEALADYIALRDGQEAFPSIVNDLAELPRVLIKARIAAHMTQRQLAERLGLREQQIQRYEANDYAGASIGRLEKVMRALGVTFRGEVSLPPDTGTGAALKRALIDVGIGKQMLSRRFFGASPGAPPVPGWMNAAARAARIFGADITDVLSGNLPAVANVGAFRASTAANRELLNGYARYAQYLAERLVEACTVDYTPLPDVMQLRSDLGDDLADKPLESLLRTCWEHGVPVLPLSDPGAFYGACWWVGDRPVIALKNAMRSPDRWSFLLAHEMDHARHAGEDAVLEADISVREWRELPVERRADDFASNVLLGDSAEAMVHVAIDQAGGEVSRLKAVLPAVAMAGNVSLGLLADHVASRISSNDINWWPTANRLHPADQDAWRIARNLLFEYVDLSRLDSLDREIVVDGVGP